ncbi:hypothetical protein ACWEPN_43785, partial [Nonomuraea wenchangensis]
VAVDHEERAVGAEDAGGVAFGLADGSARSSALAHDRSEQAVAELMREATAAAAEIRERSAARMPELVARVTGLVRALADEPS